MTSPSAMIPTNTAIIHQVTAGSFLRVIWYACHTWWYQRVFFGVAGAFASLLLRAMVASLVACGDRPHANGNRLAMPVGVSGRAGSRPPGGPSGARRGGRAPPGSPGRGAASPDPRADPPGTTSGRADPT